MGDKITQRELVAQAKRLLTAKEGLEQIEEGASLAIGQLSYLWLREHGHNGLVTTCTEYRESEEVIARELAYLKSVLYAAQGNIIRALAYSDDRDACELEQEPLLDEVEDILKGKGGVQ